MKKIKKILLFFFFFTFFLVLNIFVNRLQNDEIWNYGFAYNIYKGLVPYKDFNMVLTPMYPFLMSFPFHIFGGNLIVFHAVNALLLTVLSYLVYQMIGKKAYILGLISVIFSNSVTFPSYNLFLLFLVILIVYFEKKENTNDYWIGFLIGFCVLTKQTVGVFLFLPSFYYWKDKKKLLKRFIGFVVPCFLFFIWLLFHNTFFEFLDLCLFGLFDFGTKNYSKTIFGYVTFLVYLVIHFLMIRKNPHNLNYYYSLAFGSIMIPLFDFSHSIGPYLFFLLIYFLDHPFEAKISLPLVFYVSSVVIMITSFVRYNLGYEIIYPNKIPHFEYRYTRKDSIELTNKVLDYMEEHKDRHIVFLNSSAYYFRLITDGRITYIDLTNNGNFGYHGSDKIIKELEEKYKDSLIFIKRDEYRGNIKNFEYDVQSDQESIEYVMENAKKIDSLWIYDIYEFR